MSVSVLKTLTWYLFIFTNKHVYMFPRPTRLSIPNCISICSAVFAQLTADSHCTLYNAR